MDYGMSNETSLKRLLLHDGAALLDRNILATRLVSVPKLESNPTRAVVGVKQGEDTFFFDFLDTLERQGEVGNRVDGGIGLLLVFGDIILKLDHATSPIFQVVSRLGSLNGLLLPDSAQVELGDWLLKDEN